VRCDVVVIVDSTLTTSTPNSWRRSRQRRQAETPVKCQRRFDVIYSDLVYISTEKFTDAKQCTVQVSAG